MADVAQATRGRPRSAEADRAIIAAALDVLADDGAAAFSVEAVAQRAGVAKTTIYRRFAGSHELLADAMATLNDDLVDPPPDMPVRDALVLIVDGIRRRAIEGRTDRCLPQVISQAAAMPELFEIYYERVVEPRRARVRRVLALGVQRGEIRSDVDVDMLVSLFTGPMISMVMMTPPSRRAVDEATASEVVGAVLAGVATPARATDS